MGRKIVVIIWSWAPVVLWMALMYYSSSIPGDDLPKIDFPNIDKLFHFVEYFILGALLVRGFVNSSDNVNFKLVFLLSFLIASTYGILDEFHQSFTPERSVEIFDVVSDIMGSLLGLSLSIYKERTKKCLQ